MFLTASQIVGDFPHCLVIKDLFFAQNINLPDRPFRRAYIHDHPGLVVCDVWMSAEGSDIAEINSQCPDQCRINRYP